MRDHRRATGRITCAVVGMLIVPCMALADEAADRAKHHDAEGAKYFTLGDFKKAVQHYKKAYEAKPIPAFLYNIAQCHRRRGTTKDLERAVFYLESYLYKAPGAPNRADVESEIAETKAEIAKLKEQEAAVKRAAEPPAPRPSRAAPSATANAPTPLPPLVSSQKNPPAGRSTKPFYKRWWFWALVGGVAAGAAVTTAVVLQPGTALPEAGTIPPGRILVD